jgi:hypothetical protein
MPPYQAFYSPHAQGHMFCMVVHLRKPALNLTVSNTMPNRVQPSLTNVNIVVDLHTPGITLALSPAGTLTVTLHNLAFQLLCGDTTLQLAPNPSLDYQLQVKIIRRGQYEFAVEMLAGIDEADSPAVLQVMDLFCGRVDAIESTYPRDEQERFETHEEFKFNTSLDRSLVNFEATFRTPEQRYALDTLGSLLRHGNQNRNRAFNGWSIPLLLSSAHCTTIRNGFLNGEIQLREKGTPAEIRARRDGKAHAMRQLREL